MRNANQWLNRTETSSQMRQSPGTGWRFCLLFLLFFLACQRENTPLGPAGNYTYQVPEQTGDGWETASLASAGMDEMPVFRLMAALNDSEDHNIHSLLIVRNGLLVLEEYFPGDKFNLAQYTGETGFDREDTHNLCSATKSFTSTCIGLCVDNGYIQSVDEPVFDFFLECADILNAEPEKNDITFRHLLTMTSGLAWDDETYPYTDSRNDLYQLFRSSDPIRYILEKPLIETPGTWNAYRNCNTILLGELVRRASGQRLDVFSAEFLFDALGITDFEWQMLPHNVVFASGDLRLRPRDMAKFGCLFLNNGLWDDAQVISQAWVTAASAKQVDLNYTWADLDGYGFQWWVWESIDGENYDAYAASGWGGQWIVVCPADNMVVVTTGGNYYTPEPFPIDRILGEYILPAVNR